jgi:hypothetical protein
VVNVPGTFDWEADERRSAALVAAEPLATLLYEQTLILQRIERSLEALLSLTLRQANALEALADASEERSTR